MPRKTLLLIITFSLSYAGLCQKFTPKEKAYLYHAVQYSPIIENELHYFFHYEDDSLPMINDTLPDYDSIAYNIIKDPTKMQWEHQFMPGQENGLLLELAHKLAVRNLNIVIAYNTNMPKAKKEKLKLQNPKSYAKLLRSKLPGAAVQSGKIKNDIKSIMSTSYTNSDRIARLMNTSLPKSTVKNIIETINETNNSWMIQEMRRIYKTLGGNIEENKISTYMQAAGDGAGTIDHNNGYQEQMHPPLKESMPQIMNLFGYNIKNKKARLLPSTVNRERGKTYGSNQETNLHFTVWGYSEDAQTTAVILKGKKIYPLFGKTGFPYLSPDSCYGGKRTYYMIINELEHEIIADLKEQIYGKRGFEYQINQKEEYEEELRYEIKETEVDLNAKRYGGVPDTKIAQKQQKKQQEHLVWLHKELQKTIEEIKELKIAWERAKKMLSIYNDRLDEMKRTIGYSWMKYELEGCIATYSDGTIFNLSTQDMTFPGTEIEEDYELRLIGVPEEPLKRATDEVYASVIQYPTTPEDGVIFNRKYVDAFQENSVEFQDSALNHTDTAMIQQIMNDFENVKKMPAFRIVGHGAEVRRNSGADYLNQYPGETEETKKEARQSDDFKNQRYVIVKYNKYEHKLLIHAYTDNVVYDGKIPEDWQDIAQEKEKRYKNYLYSSAQALSVFDQWTKLFLKYGKKHTNQEKYEEVSDKIEKLRKKAEALYGTQGQMDFKDYQSVWK